jgi:hypothetical protein
MFSSSLAISATSGVVTGTICSQTLPYRPSALAAQVGGQAADDLRRVRQGELLVARVDALGREGQVEVDTGLQSSLLEDREQALTSRPRVGRGLEDDELAGLEDVGHGLRGGEQRAEVRLAVGRQGSRDGDDDRVRKRQARGARGGLQLRANGGELLRRDVLDVGLAAADRGHLGHARVNADHTLAGLGERDGQRKADVAESNDADGHASSLTVAHAISSLRAWSWPRRACSPAISSAICSLSAARRFRKSWAVSGWPSWAASNSNTR